MWQDPEFRGRFSEEYLAEGIPPRAMLFTSEKLLEQMATVTRCPSYLLMQYWTPFCPPPFPLLLMNACRFYISLVSPSLPLET